MGPGRFRFARVYRTSTRNAPVPAGKIADADVRAADARIICQCTRLSFVDAISA